MVSSINTANTASSFGLLEVAGPDSERFLQGQLTCNVANLPAETWQFGACCTAKGRMVANFIIACDGDRFVLRLPSDMVAILQQHLSKYAVFFKTRLQPLDWSQCRRVNQDNPNSALSSTEWQLAFPDGRTEIWSDSEAESNAPEQHWSQADIQAGIGWVTADSTEAWIPQHIGWQHLNGISFNKGCYTGQEVVARLQYLGKSKRQLVRFALPEPQKAPVMTPIVRADNGKECGELVALSGQYGLAIVQGLDNDIPLTLNGIELQQAVPAFDEADSGAC